MRVEAELERDLGHEQILKHHGQRCFSRKSQGQDRSKSVAAFGGS
jgi:hypothetical protein